jgi:hypothetical protein
MVDHRHCWSVVVPSMPVWMGVMVANGLIVVSTVFGIVRLEVGDFVSTDQFVCRTPGQLPSGYGCEGCNGRFHGGTIYNDAASGLIWVENQVSLGASETIMGKECFEQWLYDTA